MLKQKKQVEKPLEESKESYEKEHDTSDVNKKSGSPLENSQSLQVKAAALQALLEAQQNAPGSESGPKLSTIDILNDRYF